MVLLVRTVDPNETTRFALCVGNLDAECTRVFVACVKISTKRADGFVEAILFVTEVVDNFVESSFFFVGGI